MLGIPRNRIVATAIEIVATSAIINGEFQAPIWQLMYRHLDSLAGTGGIGQAMAHRFAKFVQPGQCLP